MPKGGPDGGDGGKGGDVFFVADRRYYNLSHFFPDRIYKAENGLHGSGGNKHGKNGKDLTIPVPPGTQLIDEETGEVIADLTEEEKPFVAATGGIGGKGNAHFKSSTHQTPRFAQPGMPGEERALTLNLKLIADIGLVGLPNAGKSTLLAKVTKAKPKIADYPFTTLIPNLGIIQRDATVYKIADIPGIIEGAHRGHGLGLSFLQHIERVKVIIFLIDIKGDDLAYNYELLKSELQSYNEALLGKKHLVVLSKIDTADQALLTEKALLFNEPVVPISALTGENIDLLLEQLDKLMETEHASQEPDEARQ
jgi:GTPase